MKKVNGSGDWFRLHKHCIVVFEALNWIASGTEAAARMNELVKTSRRWKRKYENLE
jgi:hypothetical protein